MKKIVIVFAAIFLFSCNSENSGGEQGKDLSTDEAVMEEIKAIEGNEISKDDICIERPSSFKDLIIVGFFAHDRGCMGGMTFYKGNKIELRENVSRILNDKGWSDKSKREKLALNWVKEISLLWEYTVSSADNQFNRQSEHPFVEPSARTEGNNIIVLHWAQEPSGMTPEANYYLLQVTFAEDGSIVESKSIDSFTIEY